MIRLGLLLLLLGSAPALADSPRERTSFDNGWRFTKDDPAGAHDVLTYEKVKPDLLAAAQEWEDAAQDQQQLPAAPTGNPGKDVAYVQPGFDDSGWRPLNLPHDWGIEGPFKQEYSGDTGKLPYWGVGWYRKKFDLPKSDEGRQVCLQIDGAMSYSMVWINGHFVGGWPYGYTSYQVDLTPYLNFGGSNVVAVRLDNPDKSSRWYPGGGIYRHVWLEKTSPVHVAYHGTYVTTPDISSEQATVDLKVRVENHDATPADLVMTTTVHELAPDDTRTSTPVATPAPVSISVPSGMRQLAEAKLTVPKPKLWDIANPNRYVAVTTLTQNGKVVDEY
jgi:beta-galactosidase